LEVELLKIRSSPEVLFITNRYSESYRQNLYMSHAQGMIFLKKRGKNQRIERGCRLEARGCQVRSKKVSIVRGQHNSQQAK
jgi:hypothetical protein